MATHVIIGNGENADIPQAVVNEALKDGLDDKPVVVVGWYGKPKDSLANVYDYLFDREVETILLYEDEEPVKAFREAPNFVVQKVPDMATGFVREFKGNPGAFMVLGQGDFTDTLLMDVYTAARPPLVTDLGDGLAPITLEGFDDAPEAVEEMIEDAAVTPPGDKPAVLEDDDPTDATEEEHATGAEDPDPFSFSREELLNMPHRVLKRLAAQVVAEEEMPHTSEKEPFVNAIMDARPPKGADAAATGEKWEVEEYPIEFHLETALSKARYIQEQEPSRTRALVITNMEQALLWYHYGDKIHVHGGS